MSEDGLTITNRYKKDTSVEVEKVWSDGVGKHGNDQVEFTLYRSKVGPDGTGTPYTGTIKVDSWKYEDGSPASAPTDGSIIATVKRVGEETGTEYVLQSKDNWSVNVSLREGYDYEVSFPKSGTTINSYTITSSNNTLTKETPAITLECVVPPVSCKLGIELWHDEYNTTTAENSPYTVVGGTGTYTLWFWYNNNDEVFNYAKEITIEGVQVTPDVTFSEGKVLVVFNLTGLTADTSCTIKIPNNNYYSSGGQSFESGDNNASRSPAPRRRAAAAALTPSEVQVPGMPSEVEIVTTAMVPNIKNPIELNYGDDGTYGKWNYAWAGLPEYDSDGLQWFYYVKETGITANGHTVELKDVQYDITYSDVKPRTVTKVKITNVVQQPEGELTVTKTVTGYSGEIGRAHV